MAQMPMEFEEINSAENLTYTQTSMNGRVRALRQGDVVTLYINGAFNPSAPDPSGNQYYTQIATVPDKYMPKIGEYHNVAIGDAKYTRLYIIDNKLRIIKSVDTSVYIYAILTYIGKDI